MSSKQLLNRQQEQKDDKPKYVFYPDHPFVIVWKLIVNLVYVISFFMIPLVCIDPDEILPKVRWAEFMLDILLFGDIIADFFIWYYSDTELVTDHGKIAIHYLTTYFVPEVISVSPGLFTAESIPVLYYLKTIRYVQYSRFNNFITLLLNWVSYFIRI